MNDSKGNGGKEYKFNIPVPIIVLAYFCSPPVGVILTLLKIFLPSKVKFDSGHAAFRRKSALDEKDSPAAVPSHTDRTEAAEKAESKKGGQKNYVERVLSIFFAALAAAFCL